MSLADLVGALVGLFLTLSVFSYLLGDNTLFRLVTHIFIGVAAAFAVVVVGYNILWPQLIEPLITGGPQSWLRLIIPLALSLLLLAKLSPRTSRFGSPVMAIILGAGVAAAIGGAVKGTIFPQVINTVSLFGSSESGFFDLSNWKAILNASILLIGTLATLIYFHFGRRKPAEGKRAAKNWLDYLSPVGKTFIAITLGTFFAGVYFAGLSAFVERIKFIMDLITQLFQSN